MEYLPKLDKPTTYFEKTSFHTSSWNDLKEFDEMVYDCVEGSCGAIIVNDEIIYNVYDKTRTPKQILLEEVLRHQFASNPHLLLTHNCNLEITVYMFLSNSWCFKINYKDNHYILSCFN
jgi:hypothetical protein